MLRLVSPSLACGLRQLADAAPCAAEGLLNQRRNSGTEAQSSGATFAACVLERLPVVKSPPPDWDADHNAMLHQRRLASNHFKQYPMVGGKSDARGDEEDDFTPVPITTAADASGTRATMRRQLREKLVLMVKQREGAGAVAGPPAWTFPHVQHRAGETVRATAERALHSAIGPCTAFWVGNAPMGHWPLAASPPPPGEEGPAAAEAAGTLFFMLAQVVNDPWEVQLRDSFAAEHAWVTKAELPDYVQDAQLLRLLRRML